MVRFFGFTNITGSKTMKNERSAMFTGGNVFGDVIAIPISEIKKMLKRLEGN